MKETALIQTYTGRTVDVLNLKPEDIDIEDIAWALSHLCRYTGHYPRFYSVAQHSVLVSLNCPQEHAMWGLLHDASEAYLADISAPLKRTSLFEGYRRAEQQALLAVAEAFSLPPEIPEIVHVEDKAAGVFERRMRQEYEAGLRSLDQCHGPKVAYEAFLHRFMCLKAGLRGK